MVLRYIPYSQLEDRHKTSWAGCCEGVQVRSYLWLNADRCRRRTLQQYQCRPRVGRIRFATSSTWFYLSSRLLLCMEGLGIRSTHVYLTISICVQDIVWFIFSALHGAAPLLASTHLLHTLLLNLGYSRPSLLAAVRLTVSTRSKEGTPACRANIRCTTPPLHGTFQQSPVDQNYVCYPPTEI